MLSNAYRKWIFVTSATFLVFSQHNKVYTLIFSPQTLRLMAIFTYFVSVFIAYDANILGFYLKNKGFNLVFVR